MTSPRNSIRRETGTPWRPLHEVTPARVCADTKTPSSLRCNRCGCLRGGSSTLSARADHLNLSYRHPQGEPCVFSGLDDSFSTISPSMATKQSQAPRADPTALQRLKARSAISRARSSSSASASLSCPSWIVPHPSSVASVTPAPSFLGFAYGRRLPPARQGDLAVDTDRQAQPGRAQSHRGPGRRRRS
jgi:hypothetical protein